MSVCTQPQALPCQHGMQPEYVSSPRCFHASMACSPGGDAAHTKHHFTVAAVWGWETRERPPPPPVSVAAARRSGGGVFTEIQQLLEEECLDGAAATIITNPSNYLGASSRSRPSSYASRAGHFHASMACSPGSEVTHTKVANANGCLTKNMQGLEALDLGAPIICGNFDLEDALKRENDARMARENSHFNSREEDPDVVEATRENACTTHQAVCATQNEAAPQALTGTAKKNAKKRIRDRPRRHSNTPIQDDEERYSLIQYSASSLFCWDLKVKNFSGRSWVEVWDEGDVADFSNLAEKSEGEQPPPKKKVRRC
ncbi:hypothetical protein B0H14DRAFT_2557495 [Mycena olivaceomarginata]|nr:hypothetical protein B0H14DRAFT_2557495 [Mycena olivaceomarginata]